VIERVVHVNDARPDPAAPRTLEHLRRAARLALAAAGADTTRSRPYEVSVTLVDAPTMRELNARYHRVDAPTDVLAFDLEGAGEGLLGDVYVCVDVAASAAAENDEPLERELARLTIHGILHLLGHDHPEDEDRWDSPMFRLQEQLLSDV